MSEWSFSDTHEITHQSGYKLQLQAGRWDEPAELNPIMPAGMSVAEAAKLMREGLMFASKNKPESKPKEIKREPRKAPGPRTLSLKRKPKTESVD